jgi:hypothetical protein
VAVHPGSQYAVWDFVWAQSDLASALETLVRVETEVPQMPAPANQEEVGGRRWAAGGWRQEVGGRKL